MGNSVDYKPLALATWITQDLSSNADNQFLVVDTSSVPFSTQPRNVQFVLDYINDPDGDMFSLLQNKTITATATISRFDGQSTNINVLFNSLSSGNTSTQYDVSSGTYSVSLNNMTLQSQYTLPRDTATNPLLITFSFKDNEGNPLKAVVSELVIYYTPAADTAYANTPQGLYRGALETASFEFYSTSNIQEYISILEDITLYNSALSPVQNEQIIANSTATVKTVFWYGAPDIAETQYIEESNIPLEAATNVNWMVNKGFIKPDLYSYTEIEVSLSFGPDSPLVVQQKDSNGNITNSNVISKKFVVSQLFTIDEVYSTSLNSQLSNVGTTSRYYSDQVTVKQSSIKFMSQINAYYTAEQTGSKVYNSTLPALTDLIKSYVSFDVSYQIWESKDNTLSLNNSTSLSQLTLTQYNDLQQWTTPSKINVTYSWNPSFTWNASNNTILDKYGVALPFSPSTLNTEVKFNLAQTFYDLVFSVSNPPGYHTYNFPMNTSGSSENTRLLSSRTFNIDPSVQEFKFLATVISNPTSYVEEPAWDQEVIEVGDLREYTSNNNYNVFSGFEDASGNAVFLTRAYPSGLVENFPLDNATMQVQYSAIAKYKDVSGTEYVYLNQNGLTTSLVHSWNPNGVNPLTQTIPYNIVFNENGLYDVTYSATDLFQNSISHKLLIQTSNEATTTFTVETGSGVDILGDFTSGFHLEKTFIQAAIESITYSNPLDADSGISSSNSTHYNLDAADEEDYKYFFNNVLISDISLVIYPLNNKDAQYTINIPTPEHATLKNYFSEISGNWTPPNDASGHQLLFAKELQFTLSTEDSDADVIVKNQTITLDTININLQTPKLTSNSPTISVDASANYDGDGTPSMYSLQDQWWDGNNAIDISFLSQYNLVYDLSNSGEDSDLKLVLSTTEDDFGSISFFNDISDSIPNYTSELSYTFLDLDTTIDLTYNIANTDKTTYDASGNPTSDISYSVVSTETSYDTTVEDNTELFKLYPAVIPYSMSILKRSIDFTVPLEDNSLNTVTTDNSLNITLNYSSDPDFTTAELTGYTTNLPYQQNNLFIDKGTVKIVISNYFTTVFEDYSGNDYDKYTDVSGNNSSTATELSGNTFTTPPKQEANNLSYSYSYSDYTHNFDLDPNSLKTKVKEWSTSYDVSRTQAPRPKLANVPTDVDLQVYAGGLYHLEADWLEQSIGGTVIKAWTGQLDSTSELTLPIISLDGSGNQLLDACGNVQFNYIDAIKVVKDVSGNDGTLGNISVVSNINGQHSLIDPSNNNHDENVVVNITGSQLTEVLENQYKINTIIGDLETVLFKSQMVSILIDFNYDAPTPWYDESGNQMSGDTLVGSTDNLNPYQVSGLIEGEVEDASGNKPELRYTQYLDKDILIGVDTNNDDKLSDEALQGPIVLNSNAALDISYVSWDICNNTFSIEITNDVSQNNYTPVVNDSKLDWDKSLTDDVMSINYSSGFTYEYGDISSNQDISSAYDFLNNISVGPLDPHSKSYHNTKRVLSYLYSHPSNDASGTYFYDNLDSSTNFTNVFTYGELPPGGGYWSGTTTGPKNYNWGVKSTLDQIRYGTYNPGIYYVVIMMREGATFTEVPPTQPGPGDIGPEKRHYYSHKKVNSRTHYSDHIQVLKVKVTSNVLLDQITWDPENLGSDPSNNHYSSTGPVLTQYVLVDNLYDQATEYDAFDLIKTEGTLIDHTYIDVSASSVYYPNYYSTDASTNFRIQEASGNDTWDYSLTNLDWDASKNYTQKLILDMFNKSFVKTGQNTVPGTYTYVLNFKTPINYIKGEKVEPNGLSETLNSNLVKRTFVLKVQDTNNPVLMIPGFNAGSPASIQMIANSTASTINRTDFESDFTSGSGVDKVYSDANYTPYMSESFSTLWEIASSDVHIRSVNWIETDANNNVTNLVNLYHHLTSTQKVGAGNLSSLNIKFPVPENEAIDPNVDPLNCKLYVQYLGTANEGDDDFTSMTKTVIFGETNHLSSDIDTSTNGVGPNKTSTGLNGQAQSITNRFSSLIGNN